MACKNCGRCCSYVALEVRPDTVSWLALHGIATIEQGGKDKLVIEVPCKWRDEDARRCTHYEDRPEVCRGYLCEEAKGD